MKFQYGRVGTGIVLKYHKKKFPIRTKKFSNKKPSPGSIIYNRLWCPKPRQIPYLSGTIFYYLTGTWWRCTACRGSCPWWSHPGQPHRCRSSSPAPPRPAGQRIHHQRLHSTHCKNQCCGAGAGGAEIIWGPAAGAEKNVNKHFLQSVFTF